MHMIDKEILLGTLLGDASLQTYTYGKTWRLRYIHKDKDYIFHLYEIWKPYVKTEPKLSDDGLGNTRWYFNTVVIPELKNFVDETQIYQKKGNKWVKQVPEIWPGLSSTLTEKALAYWYMGHGSKKSIHKNENLSRISSYGVKAYYFCTDCFSLREVKYLGAIIKKNWGIHVGYHKKGVNYRIYIPKKKGEEFKNLIEKYLVKSMLYKL